MGNGYFGKTNEGVLVHITEDEGLITTAKVDPQKELQISENLAGPETQNWFGQEAARLGLSSEGLIEKLIQLEPGQVLELPPKEGIPSLGENGSKLR